MPELNDIDVKENYIYKIDNKLLEILLKDHASNKNIIWATDNYESRGSGFLFKDQITVRNITGRNGLVIKPRIKKSQKEQTKRIKDKAEVFTPSWICNNQNNLVDNAWFSRENVFNMETGKTWKTNKDKIDFSNTGKSWKDYVESIRMEITCGEAPYLVSRYDTVTGEWLDLKDRIGLLDRKIRVIDENTDNEQDWLEWALKAFKSIYGFEWQGDSLLIARENLLFTFIDYYLNRFGKMPSTEILIEVAKIISWNIWQMDGLKYVVPESCKPCTTRQLRMFEEEQTECKGCLTNNNNQHVGVYCKIKDWKKNKSVKFIDLVKEKYNEENKNRTIDK